MNTLYVVRCDLGRGLFAGRDFAAGEPVLTFVGPVISLADALAKGDEQRNPLQIDDESYLDLLPPDVSINHSCDPNAGVVGDRVLTTLRPVRRGDEVGFDYSTTRWDGHWTMPCRCGAARCRGVVKDFPHLPAGVRAEYLRLGVVQGFIVRRLRANSPPG